MAQNTGAVWYGADPTAVWARSAFLNAAACSPFIQQLVELTGWRAPLLSARTGSAETAVDVALAMVSEVRAERSVVNQPAIGYTVNRNRPNALARVPSLDYYG